MISHLKKFWALFQQKEFSTAVQAFDQLNEETKAHVFAALFQKSEYANKPHSISVLFRQLHDGKTFEDFHEAWFPPEEALNTKVLEGKTYHQFFPASVRVINAINMHNPKEVVSVGIHWLNEDQASHFDQVLDSLSNSAANKQRGENIEKVADKTQSGIFMVESDDNLGQPF